MKSKTLGTWKEKNGGDTRKVIAAMYALGGPRTLSS
jgi:hypothetical protein